MLLEVSATRDFLVRDGKPFFYLADTAWMAFANLPLHDWSRYLVYRRLQGFNALQISILPITHDTSVGNDNINPFLSNSDGTWNFTAYNEDYFTRARTMVEMATQSGFVPVLGVLWCSYVPGTRCSESSPIPSAMPLDAVEPYASYVARLFKPYDPVFFISGDTRFESPDEDVYYNSALQAVTAVCPNALITMHLHPQGDLPQRYMEQVDFYMYQSGHEAHRQDLPYLLAEKFSHYPVRHPVVNSEPCYEGHGRVGERTRFSAFDIRKATWQSLLSGAKMGITYGGHGIWSFHRRGMNFLNKDRSLEPYDWDTALELDGAWDVSFAKWIFETYNLFDVQPATVVLNEDHEIRAAVSADMSKAAIYSPCCFDLEVNIDLSGYRCVMIDLASKRVMAPDIKIGETSCIAMPRTNSDVLFLAVR